MTGLHLSLTKIIPFHLLISFATTLLPLVAAAALIGITFVWVKLRRGPRTR
jgi:hypothetical protein